ncbi:hypothetical protein HYH03_002158 [Edaphochlamys debaryana]|uniref:EGF-like domain-containing protein n=1 Tax=Edaphochlamys debaryana TaxID=47281 RepID=A0A835YDZ6_9CHLO|nr:hypothetical protein HYH03_002158 [Edaphochlamys debaryana]|eukprot:KAG2499867.1 hypothetical protein HYH03_002158 [Edaphochlamys debaryana]
MALARGGDCKPGFHRNTSSPNVLQCIDDDECSLPGACVNGLCSNMPGSYTCYCPPGYSIGNDVARNFVKICVPNDACAKAKAAGKVTCIYPVNSCYNTLDHPWGYSCACIVGTEVVNTTSGMGCVDTNECGTTNASKAAACGPAVSNCTNECATNSTNWCGPHGTCVNLNGTYTCNCTTPGYRLGRTLLRKPTCVWDPCAAYRAAALQAGTTPPCAVFGICFNLASANATYPRGYYCDCTAGYMPSTVAGGDTTCISTVSRPPTCATLLSNPCAPGNCTNAAVPADNSCGWDCRCSLPLIRTLGPNGGCPRCSLVTIGDL